jgi:hypothetical protein
MIIYFLGLIEVETDPNRLRSRQKQIDIGKNTPGYHYYIQAVPKYDYSNYQNLDLTR